MTSIKDTTNIPLPKLSYTEPKLSSADQLKTHRFTKLEAAAGFSAIAFLVVAAVAPLFLSLPMYGIYMLVGLLGIVACDVASLLRQKAVQTVSKTNSEYKEKTNLETGAVQTASKTSSVHKETPSERAARQIILDLIRSSILTINGEQVRYVEKDDKATLYWLNGKSIDVKDSDSAASVLLDCYRQLVNQYFPSSPKKIQEKIVLILLNQSAQTATAVICNRILAKNPDLLIGDPTKPQFLFSAVPMQSEILISPNDFETNVTIFSSNVSRDFTTILPGINGLNQWATRETFNYSEKKSKKSQLKELTKLDSNKYTFHSIPKTTHPLPPFKRDSIQCRKITSPQLHKKDTADALILGLLDDLFRGEQLCINGISISGSSSNDTELKTLRIGEKEYSFDIAEDCKKAIDALKTFYLDQINQAFPESDSTKKDHLLRLALHLTQQTGVSYFNHLYSHLAADQKQTLPGNTLFFKMNISNKNILIEHCNAFLADTRTDNAEEYDTEKHSYYAYTDIKDLGTWLTFTANKKVTIPQGTDPRAAFSNSFEEVYENEVFSSPIRELLIKKLVQ